MTGVEGRQLDRLEDGFDPARAMPRGLGSGGHVASQEREDVRAEAVGGGQSLRFGRGGNPDVRAGR